MDLDTMAGKMTVDPLDDDDYTGMPDLCEAERRVQDPDEAEGEVKQRAGEGMKQGEGTEPVRARVGEWEDILGSGRLR